VSVISTSLLSSTKHKAVSQVSVDRRSAEHEISQAQYYQWREMLLANAARAFEPAGAPLVGEFALELKKSEEVLG
jgi:hypothetical protein